MWRYRELLPLFDGETPVTLGEGFTPLVHARSLGASIGLDRLYVKDESLNPTNSFKARGQSAAMTRARGLGATTIALPTAGNAGNAAAAYSAAAGLACERLHPEGRQAAIIDECRLYGANVMLVDGLITDAGRMAAEQGGPLGWFDRVDAEGAVSHRRQEDDGLRAGRAAGLALPGLDPLSDRRRHGMVGMWKAFDELERLGWIATQKRPRMVSVQAKGARRSCVRFSRATDKAEPWEGATTLADGLRVPRAIGDFLILRAVRESGGTALAVDDATMIADMQVLAREEGISAAPEGAATLAAARVLLARGFLRRDERIVLFNTGAAWKYGELLPRPDLPVLDPADPRALERVA